MNQVKVTYDIFNFLVVKDFFLLIVKVYKNLNKVIVNHLRNVDLKQIREKNDTVHTNKIFIPLHKIYKDENKNVATILLKIASTKNL